MEVFHIIDIIVSIHPACPWSSPGQSTGVGSRSLLQRIFPTQESNSGLLHCSRIHLSHQGSPFSLLLFAVHCTSPTPAPIFKGETLKRKKTLKYFRLNYLF